MYPSSVRPVSGKTSVSLAALAAALLLPAAVTVEVHAQSKKDVTDPVLQEILQSFNSRMPRFINKYGETVFVADEPVTRSTLMLALYEYDRSSGGSRKEGVSRKEFNELRGRIESMERKGSPAASAAAPAGAADITQIINDLQPNLPVLLDNSLGDSRVFSNLQRQMADISRRVDRIGTAPAASTAAPSDVDRRELDDLRSRMAKLEQMKPGAPAKTAGGGQLLTDVREQLPGMLDRSLDESKPFRQLQRDVADSGKSIESVQDSLQRLQSEVRQVASELDRVGRRGQRAARSSGDGNAVRILKAELENVASREDFERVSRELTYLEEEIYEHDRLVERSLYDTRDAVAMLVRRLDALERSLKAK